MSRAAIVSASRMAPAWVPSMPVTVTCLTRTSELDRSQNPNAPTMTSKEAIAKAARERRLARKGIDRSSAPPPATLPELADPPPPRANRGARAAPNSLPARCPILRPSAT